MSTIDDFIRAIQEDERQDKAEHFKKLPPIEYARLRKMVPQRVYYFLRQHRNHTRDKCKSGKHIQLEDCICGRRVLDVEEADFFFNIKQSDLNALRRDKETQEAIDSVPGAREQRELALEAADEDHEDVQYG